jgi:hypothetical protein
MHVRAHAASPLPMKRSENTAKSESSHVQTAVVHSCPIFLHENKTLEQAYVTKAPAASPPPNFGLQRWHTTWIWLRRFQENIKIVKQPTVTDVTNLKTIALHGPQDLPISGPDRPTMPQKVPAQIRYVCPGTPGTERTEQTELQVPLSSAEAVGAVGAVRAVGPVGPGVVCHKHAP